MTSQPGMLSGPKIMKCVGVIVEAYQVIVMKRPYSDSIPMIIYLRAFCLRSCLKLSFGLEQLSLFLQHLILPPRNAANEVLRWGCNLDFDVVPV
jgi:hypothetical protein